MVPLGHLLERGAIAHAFEIGLGVDVLGNVDERSGDVGLGQPHGADVPVGPAGQPDVGIVLMAIPGEPILDDSDAYGVEMALQLADKAGGGDVILISMAPGGAVPPRWPGPKAGVRPLAPASTIRSTPRRGAKSRATGQVSAQGQGLARGAPPRVSAQAVSSRTWASQALAWT